MSKDKATKNPEKVKPQIEELTEQIALLQSRIESLQKSQNLTVSGSNSEQTSIDNKEAKSETRYLEMLDNFQDLVYIADSNFRIVFLNKAMEARFKECGLNHYCYEFIHNQPNVCSWCSSQNVISKLETSAQEIECSKLNAVFSNLDIPILGPSQEVQRLTIMRDITELRKVQAEQEKFFDLVTDLFCIIDKNRKLKTVNPAWERILGFKREQLLDKTCEDMVCAEDTNVSKDNLRKLTQNARQVHYQVRMKTAAGGYKWISWNFVYSADDELFYGVGRDIHESKLAEAEKVKLQEQLLHVQKLESLGVLAGGIAHDFNNLLTGILGNADLALTEIPEDSAAVNSIKEVKNAALRSADLAKQMLAYSGKGKFIVQPVNINTVIDNMKELLNISVSKKVNLRYNLGKNIPMIIADTSQVKQVLINLVTNASEALEDKSGMITLTTGKIWADRKYLAETYVDDNLPSGFYVYIEVSDTGCGIDKENQLRIFEPFYTTKFTGRGLGLAAVMGIVRGHNGAIKIYSEVNRGSIFKIIIPSIAEKEVNTDFSVNRLEGWQGKGTILIADDDQVVLNFASRILSNAGFNVLKASDGLEAIGLFTSHHSDISLVLLDYTMPNLNGDEVFARMRRMRKDVKVVLSTGYSEEIRDEFIGKGLAGFIQKPYVVASLIDVVKSALEQN